MLWVINNNGNKTDTINVDWIGHCSNATAAVVLHDEPAGDKVVNGVTFNPSLKKGLLVALYDNFSEEEMEWTTAADPRPHEWHRRLEEDILGNDRMFALDTHNSEHLVNDDIVWNYPITGIDEATYIESPDEDDHRIVQITAKIKYWYPKPPGEAKFLYYKYDVEYGSDGRVSDSVMDWWKIHPSTPPYVYQRPDRAWMPPERTEVSGYWNGELDYDNIKDIIPLD